MLAIPQSTSHLVIFKAFLDSDHVSEATGKTIAITISKNGGAFGNPNAGATNATEISAGWYKVTLDTTDTGTLGPIAVRGTNADIDDVGVWFQVVKATNGGMTALPDAAAEAAGGLYTRGSGAGQINQPANGRVDVNVVAMAADTVTATAVANGAIDATAIADGAITAAKIADGAIDAATFAADVDAEILSYIVDDATRIDASALNTAAVTTIPDILTDTAEIGAAGAGLTAINLPDQTMNITGNITGNLSGSVGSVTGAVGSVTGAVGSVAAGGITAASIATGAIDADALAADAGTEIGTAVWASATRTLTAIDEDSTTLDLDATIRAAVGLAAADLDTQLAALPTAAEIVTAFFAESDESLTFTEWRRIVLAAAAGKADGLEGTTVHYRNQADTKNRITATVDADGNRSAVTLDAS